MPIDVNHRQQKSTNFARLVVSALEPSLGVIEAPTPAHSDNQPRLGRYYKALLGRRPAAEDAQRQTANRSARRRAQVPQAESATPQNSDRIFCRTIVATKMAVTPNFFDFCHESKNSFSPIDNTKRQSGSVALMKMSLDVVRPNGRKRFHAKSRSREEE